MGTIIDVCIVYSLKKFKDYTAFHSALSIVFSLLSSDRQRFSSKKIIFINAFKPLNVKLLRLPTVWSNSVADFLASPDSLTPL